MSEPEIRWRWVCPTWLSWAQAETYTSLPRRILRELALQRLVVARSFYSRRHPTRINRFSIDELFGRDQQPIYWQKNYPLTLPCTLKHESSISAAHLNCSRNQATH
jgi:hypothetical protein